MAGWPGAGGCGAIVLAVTLDKIQARRGCGAITATRVSTEVHRRVYAYVYVTIYANLYVHVYVHVYNSIIVHLSFYLPL